MGYFFFTNAILNPYSYHFGLNKNLPTMKFDYLCFFILLVNAVNGVPDPKPKPKAYPKTQRGFFLPGRGNFGHQNWFLRNRNYRRSPADPWFDNIPYDSPLGAKPWFDDDDFKWGTGGIMDWKMAKDWKWGK